MSYPAIVFAAFLLISAEACWTNPPRRTTITPQLTTRATPTTPFPGATQDCYDNVKDGVQGFCIQNNCCKDGNVMSRLCMDYPGNVKCCFSSNSCGATCGTCSDSTARTKACDILAMYERGRILLKSEHFDRRGNNPYDGASVLSNIRDTCYGKQAKRSKYENAPDGCICLKGTMLANLYEYADQFWTTHNKAMQVNSLAGGSHSKTSHHYQGTTFDVGCKAPLDHCTALKNFCQGKNAIELCYPGSSCGGHASWVHCVF